MAKKPDAKEKPPKKMTAKEQSGAFIQAAKELGVEDLSGKFEDVFKALVPPKRRKQHH